MHDGHVAQFGPTAEIYRHPRNLRAAQVFSDPPINVAPILKQGTEVQLGTQVRWTLTGAAAALADGAYTVAIRPNYVLPRPSETATVPITGKVQVTELSGSESSAHFSIGQENWVSHSHGVHPFEVGQDHKFFMDPTKCFYFAPDGALAA